MHWITAGIILGLVSPLLAAGIASADELRLPAAVMAREGTVTVAYEMTEPFTGHISLHLHWTDSLGRLVDEQAMSVNVAGKRGISFKIDMAHALAMKNHLRVDAELSGRRGEVAIADEQDTAEADFIARPPFTGWNDYQIMMWHRYPACLLPTLEQLGIDAGEYSGRSKALPDFLIDQNMRWYVESLAPAFYAEYHRWRSDQPKNASFLAAKQQYKHNRDSLAAFKRHPSLEDPAWRQRVHDLSLAIAQRYAPYRPYFYSLSDEPGIAELGAQWDFDFSTYSLAGMRRWLRGQYASLAALNAEWGTQFSAWDQVMPMTTRQAIDRHDQNFAAWADFKAWMDVSFAGALKMGADAVREGDPQAFVGIGGAQKPGWGGYDYARLTKAVTAIEVYDIGRSVDVVHSLNPAIPILGTAFVSGKSQKRQVWHELLHGNRGLILWDPDRSYVDPDGQPTKKGQYAARYYHEIRDGAGALIINSHATDTPIAIHYSQPSLRTQWLLARRAHGSDTAWMHRSATYERTHNHFMRLRESWSNLIEDQGFADHFISYQQLARGDLRQHGYQVLVLPQSSSLSAAEIDAIRQFVKTGGIAIASGMPGTYDEHSRQRAQPALLDLFGPGQTRVVPAAAIGRGASKLQVRRIGKGKAILLTTDIADYLQSRLTGDEKPVHQMLETLLRNNDIRLRFAVEDHNGHAVVGIDTHVFANGGVRIISLQTNPQLRVDELGPPDFQSNKRFDKPFKVDLHLPHAMYLYDVLTRQSLGRRHQLSLTVDPYEPTLLAASDTPLPVLQVDAPRRARRGRIVTIGIHAASTPADVSVFHIDVRNPEGKRMLDYSGNVIAPSGEGSKQFPLALNDAKGPWQVTVHDLLSGQTVTRTMVVE
ncbi:MAG: beta-galactosidase [Salinisphaera sp.]|jgi:hypothetical protein|nr:beta-galactosidase [Salinisphaera sp.]